MSAMPTNGPLQVVFSFDTTGSMSGALKEVRGRLSDMLQRLQTDIPAVTTAVVAHGDYCDEGSSYITRHVDFTNNLPQLVNFVNDVQSTHGGDEPEAYEVMLKLVRRDLAWTPDSQRVLVVIGDAFPHPADDRQNKDKIDWRQETLWLHDMGVRIYGVQVNESEKSTEFFRVMTEATEGQHLKLSQFGTLCDVIMAICYREKGAEFLHDYEAEVRAREGRLALHKDLEGVFGVLRRADSSTSAVHAAAPSTPAVKLTKAPSVSKLKKVASVSKTRRPKTGGKKTVGGSKAAKTLPAPAASPTPTATPTGAKAISKTKAVSKACKLKREKVPESNFRLSQLRWCPWKLVAVPVEAEVGSGPWRRFLKGCARGRGRVMEGAGNSKGGQGASVVCEVAVQTRPGARRHVVWCRVLKACWTNGLSLSRLLSSGSVRAQLERVMRGGCRLWLRWACVPQRGQDKVKVQREVKDVYSYAWCSSREGYRDVWVPAKGVSMQIAGAVA